MAKLVVLLCLLLGACGSRPLRYGIGAEGIGGGSGTGASAGGGAGGSLPGSGGARVEVTFEVTPNRKLDMLFMIDNSAGMQPLQTKFIATFPVFMNTLKMLPTNNGTAVGLPDLHLAVISSDSGPGKFDLPDRNCSFRGDGGRFQAIPRAPCTFAPLAPGQTYLAASMNQTVKNYQGDISDAFACIAALGQNGCGLEGQLKSVRWALDPQNVPDGNQGFLRADARLAVVLVTNEDDCSLPDDSDLADPTTSGISLYGPLASYRCNEYGHLCNVNGTVRPPPRQGAFNNLPGCISNETATGKLTKVADEVSFLKSLKSDPKQIFVAAITGPATPYSIGPDAVGNQSVLHSCVGNSGESADPAVRIQQWIAAFGDHGMVQSACAASLAPALMQLANDLSRPPPPQCIANNLIDTIPATPGIDPDCQVADQYLDNQQNIVRTILPACSAHNNAAPCWSITVDAVQCPGASLIVNVIRAPGLLPDGLTTTVSCAACLRGVPSPGCP